MDDSGGLHDPVPGHAVLTLDEVFRVLEGVEDARLELLRHGMALGLQDELVTIVRMLHDKLGLSEGGAQ